MPLADAHLDSALDLHLAFLASSDETQGREADARAKSALSSSQDEASVGEKEADRQTEEGTEGGVMCRRFSWALFACVSVAASLLLASSSC